MADRSYLYSISNQPKNYADRPDSIKSLSEWSYTVPLSYYILTSGNTKICASLISDLSTSSVDNDEINLYSIVGDFEIGFARLKRFLHVLDLTAPKNYRNLRSSIENTIGFLSQNKNKYILLETLEIDCMSAVSSDELSKEVEGHVERAILSGLAVDALSNWDFIARLQLSKAAKIGRGVFKAFRGLNLNDDYDDLGAENVLGISEWSSILYFDPWDKEEFKQQNK